MAVVVSKQRFPILQSFEIQELQKNAKIKTKEQCKYKQSTVFVGMFLTVRRHNEAF